MKCPFKVVGVFGTRPLEGNPAAIFLDAQSLPDRLLTPLARSLGPTGAGFVFPSTRAGACARVRTLLGDVEPPFLAHTVLGALHALDESGRLKADPGAVLTVEHGGGLIEARLEERSDAGRRWSLRLPGAETQTLVPDLKALMKATALVHDDFEALLPIEKSGPFLLLPLVSREALRRLTPDERSLLAYGAAHDVFVLAFFAVESKTPPRLAMRVLAPAVSVPEDPATGTVHGALATYLAAHRVIDWSDGRATYEVEQGDRFGRKGTLEVRFSKSGKSASEIEVSGSARTWVEGSLEA